MNIGFQAGAKHTAMVSDKEEKRLEKLEKAVTWLTENKRKKMIKSLVKGTFKLSHFKNILCWRIG